jgi:hypothetical protein
MRGLGNRLRSPRYAFALLLGLGYLGLVLFGQRHQGAGGFSTPAVSAGGSIFLLVLVLKWWVLGADRTALAFTPAEIQFFFPAPVSRAALLQYKVLRAQPLILVNVLVWTFLLRRGAGHPLGAACYALSLWVFFDIVFLHRLGAALTRDSATAHGGAGLRRGWPAVVLLVALCAVWWMTIQRLPPGSWHAQPGGVLGTLGRATELAPLRYLLWLFRLPLAPLEASDIAGWLAALAAAVGLLVLHLIWVVRADRAFEEAALEASARRAERIDRWRRQGSSASMSPHRTRYWIGLPASGHPVLAIVWKNITRLIRTLSPAFLGVIALVGVAGVAIAIVEGQDDPAILDVVGKMALTWVVVLSILGPQWVRIDLRSELEHLGMLRTWPLSGLVVMAGQVLSSALVLTAIQLLLGAIALLGLWADATSYLSLPQLAALLPLIALVLATLNVVALGIQNGGALLYPAWVRTEIRPGGVEQVGQHLLTAGISFLLLAVAAIGPALAASGAAYLLWPRIGTWALVPAVSLAGAGLVLESFLLLDWLGGQFERRDLSAA